MIRTTEHLAMMVTYYFDESFLRTKEDYVKTLAPNLTYQIPLWKTVFPEEFTMIYLIHT